MRGDIWPSQSVCCNAVVLVRKKDGGLHFCTDFCCLNTCMKKGLLPLAKDSGGVRESGRCWTFFLPGPKVGILANKNGGGIKTVYYLYGWQFGFFERNCMPFGLCNAPATLQQLMQNCLSQLNLIYYLIYLDDIVIFLWTAEEHLHQLFLVFWVKTKKLTGQDTWLN